MFVRAASLARYYSYTLLPVDSSQWNYGSWSSFFEPIEPHCRAPSTSIPRINMIFPSAESIAGRSAAVDLSWTKRAHVRWGKRDVDGLDRTTIPTFTRKELVDELHRRDSEQVDPDTRRSKEGQQTPEPSQTVPLAYRVAFKVQSEVARALWKPNAEIRNMINRAQRDLDLTGVAHTATRTAKQAGDLVIGMHVR